MINEPTTQKMAEKIANMTARHQARVESAVQRAFMHYEQADADDVRRAADNEPH